MKLLENLQKIKLQKNIQNFIFDLIQEHFENENFVKIYNSQRDLQQKYNMCNITFDFLEKQTDKNLKLVKEVLCLNF